MEQDPELLQLRNQLSETLTAQQFLKSDVGTIWVKLAQKEVDRLVKEIVSDKYDRDHNGFLAAKAELNVWKKMLLNMQVAASPVREQKLREKLDERPDFEK